MSLFINPGTGAAADDLGNPKLRRRFDGAIFASLMLYEPDSAELMRQLWVRGMSSGEDEVDISLTFCRLVLCWIWTKLI